MPATWVALLALAPGALADKQVQAQPTDRFAGDVLPQLEDMGIPIWVSVGGFSTSEYAELCAILDRRSEVAAVELNVSCPNVAEPAGSVSEIVSAARARFGTIDILVNNAGVGQATIRADNRQNPIKFWEVTPEQWKLFVAVHNNAPMAL